MASSTKLARFHRSPAEDPHARLADAVARELNIRNRIDRSSLMAPPVLILRLMMARRERRHARTAIEKLEAKSLEGAAMNTIKLEGLSVVRLPDKITFEEAVDFARSRGGRVVDFGDLFSNPNLMRVLGSYGPFYVNQCYYRKRGTLFLRIGAYPDEKLAEVDQHTFYHVLPEHGGMMLDTWGSGVLRVQVYSDGKCLLRARGTDDVDVNVVVFKEVEGRLARLKLMLRTKPATQPLELQPS